MDVLAHVHDDHRVLEAQCARLELLLSERTPTNGRAFLAILHHFLDRLEQHIHAEERAFYTPLRAGGQAREELVAILTAEHRDLLRTIGRLRQLRGRGLSAYDEEVVTYAAHLLELYREHSDREQRWLFPLLEQPAPSWGWHGEETISKEISLNALVKQFPELEHVLHAFQLDRDWFGHHSLEEAAWHSGVRLDTLLEALQRRTAAPPAP